MTGGILCAKNQSGAGGTPFSTVLKFKESQMRSEFWPSGGDGRINNRHTGSGPGQSRVEVKRSGGMDILRRRQWELDPGRRRKQCTIASIQGFVQVGV